MYKEKNETLPASESYVVIQDPTFGTSITTKCLNQKLINKHLLSPYLAMHVSTSGLASLNSLHVN